MSKPNRKRIFYFCPDFPQPSGGIKKIYRHVERLNELGLNAAVVHQKSGFRVDWHTHQVPIVWLEDKPQFDASDTWAIPEVMTELIRQTSRSPVHRILLAMSWTPTYSRLKPGERWQDHGVTRAITTSAVIADHFAWSMDLDVTIIPEFVNPELYYPEEKSDLSICYLTRKDQSGAWLQGVISRRTDRLAAINWVPLREMDEPTYATRMRQASVYLATTLQEGMHVSVLEAMACGALVIGYSGIGGSEYMIGDGPEQNCVLVENGNLLALGQRVEEVLTELVESPDRYAQVVENGVKTAARYQNRQAEVEALRAFYNTAVL